MFFIAKSRWWWCETDERRRRRRIHTLLSETRFVDQGPHIPNSRKKGRKKRKIRGSGKHLHHQKNGREEKIRGGEASPHLPKDLLHCTRKKRSSYRSSFFNSKRVGKSSSFSGIVFNVHTPSFLLFPDHPKSVFYGKVGGGVDRTIVNSQMAAER